MATWTNSDGLEVRFGSDIGSRGSKAAVTTGAGKLRELVLTVDLAALGANGTGFTSDLNNDGTPEAFNSSNTPLPIGSVIHAVRLITVEAAAGGTSFSVGTYQEDGTVVDADGIWTDVGAAGAQVGATVASATGPWYVAPKATGTYTAGVVKVIVEFMTV